MTEQCPKCGSTKISRERCLDGDITCKECGYKWKDKKNEIPVSCTQCKGKSHDIKIDFNDYDKVLDCFCSCGNSWKIKFNIHKNPDPPKIYCYMEQKTGLICVEVIRFGRSDEPKKALRIKIPESRLIPTAEGATLTDFILSEKDK